MTIDGGDEWCANPSSSEVCLAYDFLIDDASVVFKVIVSNSLDMLLGGSLLLVVVIAVDIIVVSG